MLNNPPGFSVKDIQAPGHGDPEGAILLFKGRAQMITAQAGFIARDLLIPGNESRGRIEPKQSAIGGQPNRSISILVDVNHLFTTG
jgi:hypothetical protein